jgi:hypothetical protein
MALSVEIGKQHQVDQMDMIVSLMTHAPSDLPGAQEFRKEDCLRPPNKLFGWDIDPITGLDTCLACIGGYNIDDVQFLLGQPWPVRSAFLRVSECATSSFSGWCRLFYVTHGTLVKLKSFGNFTQRAET